MFNEYYCQSNLYEFKNRNAFPTTNFVSFDHLFQQLSHMCNQEPNFFPSTTLKQNPYFYALKDILIDKKREIGMPLTYDFQYNLETKNSELDSNLMDCFAMVDEDDFEEPSTEQKDRNFCNQVEEIREDYERAMKEIEQGIQQCKIQLNEVLKNQQDVRPVTQQDIQNSFEILKQRQLFWETELKAVTCNRIMLLRTRLNTKRKRKNFSKEATRILNEYFDSHMDQPYPDDETKAELAKKCGITLVQVSNWFGNKRIRFRKALLKKESENKNGFSDQNVSHSSDSCEESGTADPTFSNAQEELALPFMNESSSNDTYDYYI